MSVEAVNERMPNWLRWVLLLPGILVAYVITHVVTVVGGSFADFMSGTVYGTNMTKYILAPGFAAYCAVGFIGWLKPRPHKPAGVVGTGFLMFLFGAFAFFAVLDPGWRTILPVVASTIGAGMAFFESN